MRLRCATAVLIALVPLTALPAHARRHTFTDVIERLLATVREHRRALEASIPRREEDVREAVASLDRNSALYARGAITRQELAAAAREVSDARAELERARQEISRTAMLATEIEARRRYANLAPLRPGQYEVMPGLVRYSGARELSPPEMAVLERYFVARAGRVLPVSAIGQTDVHTRLGLDHRHAVDLALHPDSTEGRLVMAWLRERGIAFLAYREARFGAATGAHIHVGRPSERLRAVPVGPSTTVLKKLGKSWGTLSASRHAQRRARSCPALCRVC